MFYKPLLLPPSLPELDPKAQRRTGHSQVKEARQTQTTVIPERVRLACGLDS